MSITHVNTNNIAMWVTLQNNADWDFFRTPILREILRIQNLLRVEHCAFLEVIHFSNKLDVQETNFSFTQFNRIRNHSLDAGLRLDGVPALDLWDLIVCSSWKHDSEPYRTGRLVKEQT